MKIDLSFDKIRPIPIAAAAIVVLHLLASLTHPEAASITYFATLLADAVALYACLRRASISTDVQQLQWRLIATFFLCHYLGEIVLHLGFSYIGLARFHVGVHEFVSILRLLPLLLAVVMPELGNHQTQDSNLSLWIGSLQALLFVGLAYFSVFYTQAFGPSYAVAGTAFPTSPEQHTEYAIFAVVFLMRLFARSAPVWTLFYTSMSFYLGGIACVAFFAPRWHASAGSADYIVTDLVILIFALSVGREPKEGTVKRQSAANLYLNQFGPVVFPVIIFLLAVDVAKVRFNTGIEIMGLSLVLFAIRTISLQGGYRRMQEQMVEDNQMTILEARIDQLTGIPNRRSFDRTMDREWRRAERSHQPMGLLMIDVDKFKHLNDTQGHPAGDRCLKRIGSILDAKLTRATDFVARYGGEEFSVILTDTSEQDIKAIAESLRQAVAEARLPNATDIGQYVSISIGAALTYPAPPLTPSSLLSGADQALYQAKRGGRNRVHFTNLLDAPSARAQTDGALQMLVSNYKESVYGTEPDPLANRERVRSKTDRRQGNDDESGVHTTAKAAE